MPPSKCKCQNLWITIELWLELPIMARQELLTLSFLEPSANGGSRNTDKVTQNLWSMGLDVRCCGDVFLLEVLGHMASPRHSRIFYFKKLSSSVRRLKLCHAWTFQQQKIIQSTWTSKTISPGPHCKPPGWTELPTNVLKILEGFENSFKSISFLESSGITLLYYLTKSPNVYHFFWFINPTLTNFNDTQWIHINYIFMTGCSDFIHIFSIMDFIWPNRGLLHNVHL